MQGQGITDVALCSTSAKKKDLNIFQVSSRLGSESLILAVSFTAPCLCMQHADVASPRRQMKPSPAAPPVISHSVRCLYSQLSEGLSVPLGGCWLLSPVSAPPPGPRGANDSEGETGGKELKRWGRRRGSVRCNERLSYKAVGATHLFI